MERFHFIEQRDHLPARITGKVRLADSTSPVLMDTPMGAKVEPSRLFGQAL
jgi:hypothetical protein